MIARGRAAVASWPWLHDIWHPGRSCWLTRGACALSRKFASVKQHRLEFFVFPLEYQSCGRERSGGGANASSSQRLHLSFSWLTRSPLDEYVNINIPPADIPGAVDMAEVTIKQASGLVSTGFVVSLLSVRNIYIPCGFVLVHFIVIFEYVCWEASFRLLPCAYTKFAMIAAPILWH